MNSWNERIHEVAYLLNPAFCGRLLYSTINTYCIKTQHGFPFPLVYLVLPLVLHKETREKINSQKRLHVWAQQYPHLLLDFPQRASELIPITNEAIELLLQTGELILTSNAEFDISITGNNLTTNKYADAEIKDCLRKCEHIARWFAGAGKVENTYIALGVRP